MSPVPGSVRSVAMLASNRRLIAVIQRQQIRRRRHVLQQQVLKRVAFHAEEKIHDALVLECCSRALAEHGFALGRELTELEDRVADRDQQRHGHEGRGPPAPCRAAFEAAESSSAATLLDQARQWPAASLRSHASEVDTIVLRSSYRGCQPSWSRIRVSARDQGRRVSGAAWCLSFGQRVPRHGLDHPDDVADAVAAPVAAVQCRGFAAAAQVGQRLQVGVGQVLHVDVVAHAGAVGCRVVGAEDRDVFALADGDLAGDLRQQRGLRRGLADAALADRSPPR